MATHQITSLAGWFQVVETDAGGTATPIGSFRTEADARDWLTLYLRMQSGPKVFKVGYAEAQATAPTETEAPVTATESNRVPSPSSLCFATYATAAPMKSLLRSRPVQYLLPRLMGRYLWLILHTNRWTLDGAENFAPHGAGSPAVFSFWHEHLPLMPALAMLARRSPVYRPAPIHAWSANTTTARSLALWSVSSGSSRCWDHRHAAAPLGCGSCCGCCCTAA